MNSDVRHDHLLVSLHERRQSLPVEATLDLLLQSGKLLFANGQTTERMVFALRELAAAYGVQATIFAVWGELTIRLENGARSYSETIAVEPFGVDMSKVSDTMSAIHQVCEGKMGLAAARFALKRISESVPVSLARFTLLAGAGAAALGVIFGAFHPTSLILIVLVACAGRWFPEVGR